MKLTLSQEDITQSVTTQGMAGREGISMGWYADVILIVGIIIPEGIPIPVSMGLSIPRFPNSIAQSHEHGIS